MEGFLALRRGAILRSLIKANKAGTEDNSDARDRGARRYAAHGYGRSLLR